MVPLGAEAQVVTRFGPFRHSANLDMDWVKRTQAQKSFSTHPMELLGDVGHGESLFPFGDNINLGAR
jgi:hypothetical protein